MLRKLRAIGGKVLSAFRSTARTVGLSPKALAPWIGGGVTGILALAGLTPDVIGHAFGLDPTLVAAGITLLAAKIAVVLLPPGNVVIPAPDAPASDEMLSEQAKAKLEATTP